jgi:hypothetical protein
MQDLLKDIVSHTHSLGLEMVKITGTDQTTQIDSMIENRTMIMYGETHVPYADLVGVFGMPQLNKLKYSLDCPEYQEDAKIEVVKGVRDGEEIPVGLHFENKEGDFYNDYRFMNSQIINEKLKTVKFRGVTWDVELVPSIQNIKRLQYQAAANSEYNSFIAKTDGDKLKFTFGDAASQTGGEFVFATGITGKLTKAWSWPVGSVLAILKIADVNNTMMSFSNEGALQITLDSGIANYKYIIPALT